MAQNDVNIKIQVDASQAEKSTESYKARLKQLKDEMTALQIETDGLSKASAEQRQRFNELSAEAGKIQDAMSDTAQQVKNLSDDFSGMTATLQGIGAAVGGITAVSGAMSLFGIENEKAAATIQKLAGLMSILQGIQALQKALDKDSALMTMLRTKAQKSLNTELGKTTVAEKTATTATATFTAAEGAATTGAITLKGAVKAVGTAIKSVPVIGWILAAIAAITTLISLISDANEEEEKGVRLKERERQALDDIHAKHAQILNDILQQNNALRLQLHTMSLLSKDTVEYNDLMKNLADYTGLSAKYLETLTDAQKEQLATVYGQLKAEQAHLEELNELADEYQKKWDEARKNQYSDDEDTRKQAIADLEWMANEASDYYKKTHENAENIQKANERIAKAQKEINKERQKELDWQKEQTEAEKRRAAAIKARNEAEKEHQRFIEDSKKEIEELNAALYGNDEEEKLTEKYDRMLDLAIKYYGEESEQYAKVVELRMKSLDELKEKQAKADEELSKQRLEDERKFEDERLQVAENGIKAEMIILEEGTHEWYEKKIELDRLQEDREKQELERNFEDNLISYDTYLTQYDLIVAQHAKNRTDIELEAEKTTLDNFKQIQTEKLNITQSAFQTMGDFVESIMNAELEAVEGNAEEEKKVRRKYAQTQFVLKLGEIAASTAKAIMETWSAYAEIPFVGTALAAAQTAIIAATGTVQANNAKTAMNSAMKAEKGGILQGASHANGGIMLSNGVEAEGGEAIINKRSTAMFAPLLSDINSFNGYGAPLIQSANASGGTFGGGVSDETIQKIVSATVAGVSSIPVVVSEHAITETQRIVGITKERAFI